MFRPPDNLFCLIENAVKRRPERLCMDHWHTLPNGTEATTENQILHPECRHDLAGWIVVFTPNAARIECERGVDADDLAAEILVEGLYDKIPFGILYGEETDALKLIHGRAAEERSIN